MTNLVAIYALCEPDTGEVRYVGKADHPEKRLDTHLRQATSTALRTHKGRWISKLKQAGQKPELRVLEWAPCDGWQDAERYWIKQMLAFGCNLTNGTDGGDGGAIAASQTPEARAKRNAANRGQKRSAETRALLSEKARQRDPSVYVGVPPVRRGVANNKAKLTEADVLRLRELHSEGLGGAALAREFSITAQNVWNVVTGRTWGHLPMTPKRGN